MGPSPTGCLRHNDQRRKDRGIIDSPEPLPPFATGALIMLKEFREFAMRGNEVDMAVGIIIGAAFGKIVDSLVKDLIMPPIRLLLGKVDFSNLFLVIKQGVQA